MAQIIKDVVTWLKQWFYTEAEVDTLVGGLQSQINNKAETATVTSLTTTVGTKADKSGGVAQVTDTNANNYKNIGNLSSGATQQTINNAINTKIGELASVELVKIVDTLPPASKDTMNTLYLVVENTNSQYDTFDVYITYYDDGSETGSSIGYYWEKLDDFDLKDISIAWNKVTGKPFSSIDTATSTTSTNPITNGAITTALNGKAPTSHASSATTYGVGTTANYGHCKTVNGLTQASHSNGLALSAYQGKVLKDLIDDLGSELDNIEAGDVPFSPSATAWGEWSQGITDVNRALNFLMEECNLQPYKSQVIDINNIQLVNKGETNEGCIIFNTIS